MDCEEAFVLTDLPSDTADGTVTSRTHRCNGCAECISTRKGACAIHDGFSDIIPDVMSHRVLEIHTGISDAQFRMPMRKAVERISNILQAFTDAGGNDPLDSGSVRLRDVRVVVDNGRQDGFEEYARDLLENGPVEKVEFVYL